MQKVAIQKQNRRNDNHDKKKRKKNGKGVDRQLAAKRAQAYVTLHFYTERYDTFHSIVRLSYPCTHVCECTCSNSGDPGTLVDGFKCSKVSFPCKYRQVLRSLTRALLRNIVCVSTVLCALPARLHRITPAVTSSQQ